MKHIVCYSGGESSALVLLDVVKKEGKENVIALNHDIPAHVEHPDIKRFKNEVVDYLGMPITYANHKDPTKDQFDVCVDAKAFKVNNGMELCTNRLKTAPFNEYLEKHHAEKNVIIYYGFDANERARVQRRVGILAAQGYRSAYPLAHAKPEVMNIEVLGIKKPLAYASFKHANCTGCLKAGMQHWYIVYCQRFDIYEKAMWAEDEIGYSIHAESTLREMMPKFEAMKQSGIPQTEHIPHQTFWAGVRKIIDIVPEQAQIPCDCIS